MFKPKCLSIAKTAEKRKIHPQKLRASLAKREVVETERQHLKEICKPSHQAIYSRLTFFEPCPSTKICNYTFYTSRTLGSETLKKINTDKGTAAAANIKNGNVGDT